MYKIPNNTEVAAIFERIDIEGEVTTFKVIEVVTGYTDKQKKTFIASDGKEYSYMVATRNKYSFGLRRKIGELNKTYKQKRLSKLLKQHYSGLSQFIFYFRCDPQGENLELVCEDEQENIYTMEDRDFDSYKKHILNPTPKEINEPIEIKVNSKELIVLILKEKHCKIV